ncbi:adenylate/guanylate cyclase domain-containing protein [Georgenia sp. H159]|uniref:adenylate/guanylate cyclase domain-containing protein n=1 Tax=Georgenia sp. H159 TaxID=3076115 RepID=UPI002D792CE2|nr:adenylate/guanylate cyclase domain-containing protein [Georgenia sp. H159]
MAELIGGEPTLTMVQLAEHAGVDLTAARLFWRAMGFPNVPDDAVTFTPLDVEALRAIGGLVGGVHVDRTTAVSLLRAQSYLADRLVLWQIEALVEDASRRHKLDDTGARLVVLDRIAEIAGVLEGQLVYAWRRQLAALAERMDMEVSGRSVEESGSDSLPLPRALGFVDMVSFTSSSARLGSRELAALVQGFEFTVRDVITSHGARVVKTIGDAVMFIADDLPTAAHVAVDLVAAIKARPDLLPVRGSLVWGRVISRSGDVFGPVVNLASRLVDVAPPETVIMDPATSERLATSSAAGAFSFVQRPPADMPGIGQMAPVELRLASPEGTPATP